MSNYPPGVSGNEPEITGEWPCPSCEGAGGERDEDGAGVSCWFCSGSGIAPEEAPPCPDCGEKDTVFVADCELIWPTKSRSAEDSILCRVCKEVNVA